MPVIIDPDSVLPDKAKNVRPSQVMAWLLYPVIGAVGFIVGLVIGIKQGESTAANVNVNRVFSNASIIPNANTRVFTNTVEANTNISNAFPNLNSSVLSNADYLKIVPATQAQLDAQQQRDIDRLVDQTASVTDIVRQRDLISLKYTLKAYSSVIGSYPSTNGQRTKIEGKNDEVLYAAMKNFYGGSFNLKIDPESPTYFYAYTSNGTSFTLTCYLTSKQTVFTLTDGA